jgi:tripartite-type tricarboxylate transporter receptor subunit TctC
MVKGYIKQIHSRNVAPSENVLIGVGVGGEYDLQARMVARHLGKHIPGSPTVVPQNMIGAGGIKMANYLFAHAARDGTNIGMMGNNFPATDAVGGSGVQYGSVTAKVA